MFIERGLQKKIDDLVALFNFAMWGAVGLVLLFFFSRGSSSFVSFSMEETSPRISFDSTQERDFYEQIGRGALELKRTALSPLVVRIKNELVVIAENSRPGNQQREILIGLKGSKEIRTAAMGAPLFLELLREENRQRLRLSAEATSLAIIPKTMDQEWVLFEVEERGMKTALEGERFMMAIGKEAPQFAFLNRDLEAFNAFEQCHWWGQDLFFEKYGGAGLSHLKQLGRLEFFGHNRELICSVQEGDLLVWHQGEWRKKEEGEAVEAYPLAKVGVVGPSSILIKIWDRSGFFSKECAIPLQKDEQALTNFETLLTQLRQRSASSVACLIGGKRAIIKVGDWILRDGKKGWTILKTKEEIDALLQSKLRGDLFVVDELKQEKESWRLRGHIFNPMHTHCRSISIPIALRRGGSSGKTKRSAR